MRGRGRAGCIYIKFVCIYTHTYLLTSIFISGAGPRPRGGAGAGGSGSGPGSRPGAEAGQSLHINKYCIQS